MYGFGLCRSRVEDERAMRGNDGELGGRGVLGTCTEGKERAELEVVGASSKVKPLHHKERHT